MEAAELGYWMGNGALFAGKVANRRKIHGHRQPTWNWLKPRRGVLRGYKSGKRQRRAGDTFTP